MEEMLAVPKLYVPISTCMLRVINNDTGEEIPRVFQKVAPYVYKKNRVSSFYFCYKKDILGFIFVIGKKVYWIDFDMQLIRYKFSVDEKKIELNLILLNVI